MIARHLVPLAVGPLCLGLGAGPVCLAQEDAPAAQTAEVRSRAALVLFVSYRGELLVFPDPTQVRRAAARLVSGALAGPDLEIVTYPVIEPAMREWRVRSERDLGLEFLAALAARHDLESIVIGSMVVTPDRIVLLIRRSSLETGNLQGVEILEEPTNPQIWADAEGARLDLEFVVGRLAREFTGSLRAAAPADSTGRIVLLPLRPVGTDRGYAALAVHSLLIALRATTPWAIADPALALNTLQEEGFDPLMLDRASRATLADRFGAGTILVARLTAFPAVTQTPAQFDADIRAGIGPSFAEGIGTPFHFSVTAIDHRTGRVVSAADTYLAADDPTGIFGRRRDVPLAERFLEGAKALVERLFPEGGR